MTKTANSAQTGESVVPVKTPVSIEDHHRIEQFLYTEAAVLDSEELSHWLATMVDPAIRYQMVVRAERHVRDKTPLSARELMVYDDDIRSLKLRIKQFDTGLQRMMDPRQTIRRFVSNVRAVATEVEGQFEVTSYGKAYRFRREYDKDEVVYQRTDLIQTGGEAGYRIVQRRIDLLERVIRSKNLLFFL